jgi:hypothetical protein
VHPFKNWLTVTPGNGRRVKLHAGQEVRVVALPHGVCSVFRLDSIYKCA